MNAPNPSARSTNAIARLQHSINPVRPAYEQVADQLRTLVISGELRPGERLPSEGDLATMFGVGQTTVREALRLLAAQGLVNSRRGVGGGTFIISPNRDAISRYLETSLGLLAGSHRPAVEDLLEARLALEKPAARLAAIRHDKAQFGEISKTIPEGPAPNEDMYQSKFHVAVLKASGNIMLEVMTRLVFDVLRTRLVRSAAPANFWDQVVDDHRQILHAISQRKAKDVEEAMKEHLDHLASVYRDIDEALHRGLRLASYPALTLDSATDEKGKDGTGGP